MKPDLILLDLSMPGMNGMETAPVLKRQMPRVLIVAFSVYAELLGKSPPSTVGIDAVIDKLAGIGKVVECARNLLRVVTPNRVLGGGVNLDFHSVARLKVSHQEENVCVC